MTKEKELSQSKVPKGRVSRLFKLGSMATKIAGDAALSGAKQFASGQRPKLTDLLLTPANINRIGTQLANMRGAAMKIGQLISMDAGDFLPEELTRLLEHLRSDAQAMPIKQLTKLLEQEWGADWQDKFIIFSLAPFAAASIGQVHKATTNEGQLLAVKIQYPGVKQSIDSDIDNVAALLNLSGLLPRHLDIQPLLQDAKKQLQDEADYRLESSYLLRYRELLENDAQFVLPEVHDSLTTDNILAMSFVEGEPIENLQTEVQAVRDKIIEQMIQLLLREVFEFGLIQTDPNFANYQYQPKTGKIVLFDFGATREFPKKIADAYLKAIKGCIAKDKNQVISALQQIGLLGPDVPGGHSDLIFRICMDASDPIQKDEVYDFGKSDIGSRMQEAGFALNDAKQFWHAPPADAVYLHRKVGGLFLLACRLKAKVNVQSILSKYL